RAAERGVEDAAELAEEVVVRSDEPFGQRPRVGGDRVAGAGEAGGWGAAPGAGRLAHRPPWEVPRLSRRDRRARRGVPSPGAPPPSGPRSSAPPPDSRPTTRASRRDSGRSPRGRRAGRPAAG